MSVLSLLWNKTTALVVGFVAILAAIAGIRHSIRSGAKDELRSEIKERTIERVRVAKEISNDVEYTPDGDILDKLRDNGWLRQD